MEMTVGEALRKTIELLEDTQIPIKFHDTVGTRINGAINNLKLIENWYNEQMEKANKEEEAENEVGNTEETRPESSGENL